MYFKLNAISVSYDRDIQLKEGANLLQASTMFYETSPRPESMALRTMMTGKM